jgi:hypothetical protein
VWGRYSGNLTQQKDAHKFGGEEGSINFSIIWVTLTAVKDLPHSKQYAFDRDVINPQDGHILSDPYSAPWGCGLRILWRNGIANSATIRPKKY